MCGIVGVFARDGHAAAHADQLQRATDRIAHRGPDDDGFAYFGPVGFGFRRLSILDLSLAGHQPMTSADGAWTVVFNGEIYNFIELRQSLLAVGVQFRSDSDTEVLVECLSAFGTRCFERFNGMWAVLAYHHATQTLWACRDPWGIKPIYVHDDGRTVVLASEIKALRAFGCDLGEVDAASARRFLDHGELDCNENTMRCNVKRLLPGRLYRYRSGSPDQVARYTDPSLLADVPRFAPGKFDEAAFVEAFRGAFMASVKLRLRSDVDVGTCLSGGLDSSAIFCAAARFLAEGRAKVCRHAFTALTPEYDESAYIQSVIAHTEASWHVTMASDEQITTKINAFFDAHDEPVHSLSPFAGYLVMGLARDAGVKVLLNGQGADELMAGYHSTVVPFLRSMVDENGPMAAAKEALAEGGDLATGVRLFARAEAGTWTRNMPGLLRRTIIERRQQFSAEQADGIWSQNGPLASVKLAAPPPAEMLRADLQYQVECAPLPLYLRIEDLNSSAFSLEARLPFLDPRVVALARMAPASMLRRGGLNKYLLRQILPQLTPEIVWKRRDKMGFPVPEARWWRGPLRDMVCDTLNADRLRARGWYRVDRVGAKLDHFLRDPTAELPARLRRVLMLERWARHHLDAA